MILDRMIEFLIPDLADTYTGFVKTFKITEIQFFYDFIYRIDLFPVHEILPDDPVLIKNDRTGHVAGRSESTAVVSHDPSCDRILSAG